VKLTVNGEERDFDEGLTIARLLEVMNVPRSGTAVARNDRVVRRAEHGGVLVEAGDRIEIIRAAAGG
jgi:sulfur carrier protein